MEPSYYMSFGGLSKGALHPDSPPTAPVERDASFLKAFLDMSLGVPIKGAPPPSMFPLQSPYIQIGAPLPEPSFTYLS
jgi:hypothetical protein